MPEETYIVMFTEALPALLEKEQQPNYSVGSL